MKGPSMTTRCSLWFHDNQMLSVWPHNPNLYFDLFQQVTRAGAFTREQHEDDRLKHCWAQVRIGDRKEHLMRRLTLW